MTAGAERFVTPLTFASLSGRQVLTSIWQPTIDERAGGDAGTFDIEHIRAAQDIDVFVIAPATANVIAKFAHGLADDLLTTMYLATTAPIVLAPAMNVNMWTNQATQQNIATLRERGVRIVAPTTGPLACGTIGEGRLATPEEIAEAVLDAARIATPKKRDLTGETILITAGGTREPIDPVRFIGNKSSGRMGFALAEASIDRGAQVILITSASNQRSLPCEQIQVNTASEMKQAVLTQLPRASIVIMAAAVSDYRLARPASQKLKTQASLTLELERNDDILKLVVEQRRPGTIVIGFAAETERLLEEGRRKLREKGVDAIVANDVSHPDSGFEVDRNAGVFLTPDTEIALPSSSKRTMADRILDQIILMPRTPGELDGVNGISPLRKLTFRD
jgi:phosphopantothenoylcysteine decarboxylase/phosphopantothenate--cysteine ligase